MAKWFTRIDTLEAAGFEAVDVSANDDLHIHNCIAAEQQIRPYSEGQHGAEQAWLQLAS